MPVTDKQAHGLPWNLFWMLPPQKMQDIPVVIFICLFLRAILFTAYANDSSTCTYFNFNVETFHRLTSHKISSVVVHSMEDCAMACLEHWECFSFNLGNTASDGHGMHECELIRTDKYNSNSTYDSSKDFHHFFVKVSVLAV